MRIMRKGLPALLIFWCLGNSACANETETVLLFHGTSHASAAVSIGEKMFLVGDDENNVLRIYKTEALPFPVHSFDVAPFLEVTHKKPEADIEGATRIGNRVYWITSHGRNKDGKMRPNRYRFFATSVDVKNGEAIITPTGTPCRTLIHDLVMSEIGRRFELDKATRFDGVDMTKQERRRLAPKENGLNVEGLCASADGKTIFIGFRNPCPLSNNASSAKTLVIPLENPRDVIDAGTPPAFGDPIVFDLGGHGIRSMEYSPYHDAYFIVAGPRDGQSTFFLHRWSGKRHEPAVLVRRICENVENSTPEALVVFPDVPRLLLLSDDGDWAKEVREVSGHMQEKPSEDKTDLSKSPTPRSNEKSFRGMWLALPGPVRKSQSR